MSSISVCLTGVQTFWPFPFDALDLRFAQARFDRTDDVQGDFVLEGENVVERTVISFGPYMNAGFGLDQLAGDPHTPSRLAQYRTPSSRPTRFTLTD